MKCSSDGPTFMWNDCMQSVKNTAAKTVRSSPAGRRSSGMAHATMRPAAATFADVTFSDESTPGSMCMTAPASALRPGLAFLVDIVDRDLGHRHVHRLLHLLAGKVIDDAVDGIAGFVDRRLLDGSVLAPGLDF